MNQKSKNTIIGEGSDIGSLTQKEALLRVKEMLTPEVLLIKEDVYIRNPNISRQAMLDQYIENLRYLKDPRIDFLDGIYSGTIPENELDQAIEVLENITKVRAEMVVQRQDKTGVKTASGLDFDLDLSLKLSVKNSNHREVVERVSVKDRKNLDILLNALVLGNMGLMSAEFLDISEPLVNDFYTALSNLSDGLVSGDYTIGLLIISVFGAEAFLKIKEQGLITYLKYNKVDVGLNVLGVVELGTIVTDVISGDSHPGIASILRGFRALRILKLLNKIPSVRQLGLQVQSAMPKTVEFTGIYVAFSGITMFMLMQMLGKHMPEFATFGESYSSMRDLFFADGYQVIFEKIEKAKSLDVSKKGLDPITKVTSEVLANIYMASSNYFYAAVVSGILVDSINQGGKRIEQMLSLTLEKVGKVLSIIEKEDKN